MSISSGSIQPDVLYLVSVASITYQTGLTVNPSDTFRGIIGYNTFSGSGTVNEVLELKGVSIEYSENGIDVEIPAEITVIRGISLEMALTTEETLVREVTNITGFSIELVDYPFYSFSVMESTL